MKLSELLFNVFYIQDAKQLRKVVDAIPDITFSMLFKMGHKDFLIVNDIGIKSFKIRKMLQNIIGEDNVLAICQLPLFLKLINENKLLVEDYLSSAKILSLIRKKICLQN